MQWLMKKTEQKNIGFVYCYFNTDDVTGVKNSFAIKDNLWLNMPYVVQFI